MNIHSMRMNSLGKTNIKLSELGCGGAGFGNLFNIVSPTQVDCTITQCMENNINYFDTAPKYGNGLSERRMGDALRQYQREDYILSSKVGILLTASPNSIPAPDKFIEKLPFHRQYDYSYDSILRSFEHSLQRLGLNYIDIAFVHELDASYHEETVFKEHMKTFLKSGYKALDKLKSQGIIRAIGFGVRQWQACAEAMLEGDYDCFMLAGSYTLLEQPTLNGFLDVCMQKKISIIQAGPYASGILATGAIEGAYFHHQRASNNILHQVKELERICIKYNIPLQAAALQFPLMHPAIVSTVVGYRTPEEVQSSLEYNRVLIPNEFWEELKEREFIHQNSVINSHEPYEVTPCSKKIYSDSSLGKNNVNPK